MQNLIFESDKIALSSGNSDSIRMYLLKKVTGFNKKETFDLESLFCVFNEVKSVYIT